MRTLCILCLVSVSAWASSPAEAVAAAYADLERMPGASRKYQRYISAYHITDAKTLAVEKQVVNFWVNSLSLSTDLAPAVEVAPNLWRVDVRNYARPPARDGGRFARTWEKLANTDPYFHSTLEKIKVPLKVEYETKAVEWEGGVWPGDGKFYAKGSFKYEKRVPREVEVAKEFRGPQIGVDQKKFAALVLMTGSDAPVVRHDWWIVETSQQTEREGTGYFDWLGVRNRDDYDALVGLDRKEAAKREKDVRAIVPVSGVALNGRQIVAHDGINGETWFTLDTVRQARRADNEKRNVVRNLDGDLVHDAEEGYGFMDNGMFAYWAGDAKGERQDSVPDAVASDKASGGNEARIAPWSCVGCHKEGIRPIDDWARRLYKQPLTRGDPDIALTGPEYEKQRRLRKLYLSDLESKIRDSQQRYAKKLFGLTGLKPEELSSAWGKLQQRYRNGLIGEDEAAREFGVTKPHLIASLKRAALTLQKQGQYLDPSFVGMLQDPPLKMRREYLEELFTLGSSYCAGIVPISKKVPP